MSDSKQVVESICGNPASQTNLQTDTEEVTELNYGGDQPQTIIFKNGKLSDWQ